MDIEQTTQSSTNTPQEVVGGQEASRRSWAEKALADMALERDDDLYIDPEVTAQFGLAGGYTAASRSPVSPDNKHSYDPADKLHDLNEPGLDGFDVLGRGL